MKKKAQHLSLRTQPSIDIEYVAKLANLPLDEKQQAALKKQLKDVLGYVAKLNEVNTDHVEPIGHITGLSNVLRDDQPGPSLSPKEALANAKRRANGFFEVEAIFEEQ